MFTESQEKLESDWDTLSQECILLGIASTRLCLLEPHY